VVRDLPDGLILFDGECVLCSGWVKFILPRDPHGQFRFASIQGSPGRELAARLGIDPDSPATNAVVSEGMAHFKSDSALAVLGRLDGWRWTRLLRFCPRFLRDWIYDRIARNRYRLFGREQHCMVPPADWETRFLDQRSR
jgi:predicted DCC family thiol-disulfide oxidoreductase YuxK